MGFLHFLGQSAVKAQQNLGSRADVYLRCNNSVPDDAARAIFEAKLKIKGASIVAQQATALFYPELRRKPMTLVSQTSKTVKLKADARGVQQSAIIKSTLRWQGVTRSAQVRIGELDFDPLTVVCEPRTDVTPPIAQPPGGGDSGNPSPGDLNPCTSSCCSCTGLRYGDDSGVIAEGYIEIEPSTYSRENPETIDHNLPLVNVGQWQKPSYSKKM
ncbi:MAG: hypothetical protein HC860_17370 [Alkalinema sp. RU_4_3]|nr:hypothetical protein [Alkalinema sp. RU_4_3]